MLRTKVNAIIFGGCWPYKSGLKISSWALKVPFLGTLRWALLPKVPIFMRSKMALWVYKWRIWDHFYKANIPQKWWNCLLFLAFTTFGWVLSQFWKMENFTLYFTKGSQKKVRRHLERAHIDSKMCSGLLGATRTRIQPVIKPARHFAHFVTR